MKDLKEYLINENEQTIKFILDNSIMLGKQTIDPSKYDIRSNDLLERIAGPLLEYIIVMKFIDNSYDTNLFYLFKDVNWNKNSSLWDFSAKISKKYVDTNKVNIEGLPVDKKLNFEVKAFHNNPHNITLTKPQIDSLSEDIYFILVDYDISDGMFDIKDMYLIDGLQMKTIIGSKSVKAKSFKKLFNK